MQVVHPAVVGTRIAAADHHHRVGLLVLRQRSAQPVHVGDDIGRRNIDLAVRRLQRFIQPRHHRSEVEPVWILLDFFQVESIGVEAEGIAIASSANQQIVDTVGSRLFAQCRTRDKRID